MYDMHFDLLTILYFLNKNNKFSNFKNILQKIYTNNIEGGIVNLYFMPEKDMLEELNISYEEYSNIIDYFQKATSLYKKNINDLNLSVNHIFGIEGCDFIESIDELKKLYNLGLRSVTIVWNYKNKYASGVKAEGDLTEEGKLFIKEAIKLNMIIDLSHMNEKSFKSVIKYIKENYNSYENLIASHSNCFSLNPVKRNLSDEQLKLLKSVGGKIGLTTYMPFVGKNVQLVDHINHLVNKLNFSFDDIFLSSDEMIYVDEISYKGTNICDLTGYKIFLTNYLTDFFNKENVNKILITNAKKIINRVK